MLAFALSKDRLWPNSLACLNWALMIHPNTFQTYEARPLCFYYTKCQLQGCWCTSSGVVNISLSFSASKSGHMHAASRRQSASFIHLLCYRFFDAALPSAWPTKRILPSPFDETQTPDSLRIGLSQNACFATWELQMYGSFCRFRISAEFSDFALKIGFRRNSIIVDQFRQNWLLNACPSKVKKNVGRIRRNCPQFRRNCPQFRRNYPDSALVTNMHSPWKPHFGRIENCRQLYLFSAEILEFGDSCAEM